MISFSLLSTSVSSLYLSFANDLFFLSPFSLSLLARFLIEKGLHRVPVVDEERQMINLITQSQFTAFLHANAAQLGAKGVKQLKDCKQFFKEIISVPENGMVVDAFKVMLDRDITGVAVVNDKGELTGNLSTRDIKAVDPNLRNFWRFYQQTHNYLKHVRAEFQQRHGRPSHLVFASANETIEQTLAKLAVNHVHRLYLLDAEKKPIGLVSLKDVIAEIIR